MTAISIGITTRDRPESLRSCLRSIAATLGPDHDVLVFDDASAPPVSEQLAGESGMPPLQILRDEDRPGYIAGRNALVREARHELVLLLDDDTLWLDAAALDRAVDVMARDPGVGAIAFAQAERDGRPWPEGMQPGRGQVPAAIASYVGFAHLLRRSVFLELGGYRELFVFYGEEKDYCLRLLASGRRVVYLPDALVAHVPDAAGRDPRRYVRYAIRNDCLSALYNDPWPLAIAGMPVRFLRYRRMSARIPGGDPGGFSWMLHDLRRLMPAVLGDRQPLTWAQVREWRRRRQSPPYSGPTTPREPGPESAQVRAPSAPAPAAHARAGAPATTISIGVTTRNRPASLAPCLRSIAATLGRDHEVLVFDDASEIPAAVQLAGETGIPPVRILRDEQAPGNIVGRNTLMRAAQHEMVLLLDDDALLLDAAAVRQAIDVMTGDPQVGAVAFAQAERDGCPWPDGMQPARVSRPAVIAAFIGFAHLLRRSVFLELGGYRELFVFYGEEKDYCLRLLASGRRVVYLPDALVAHVPDAAGRDPRRYVRYAIRNDCLSALYNDPWPLAIAGMPVRFLRYRRMSARIPGGDPGGFSWMLHDLRRLMPAVLSDRQPLTWAQVREWRRRRTGQPYPVPADHA